MAAETLQRYTFMFFIADIYTHEESDTIRFLVSISRKRHMFTFWSSPPLAAICAYAMSKIDGKAPAYIVHGTDLGPKRKQLTVLE